MEFRRVLFRSDVDLDGAYLVTCAAQRRGIRQGLRVLHVHQLRSENSADGAGVNRPVGMTTGLSVNRAGIEAGSTADALERLPLPGVSQDRGPAVVEQNDMEALRAVAGSYTGPQ